MSNIFERDYQMLELGREADWDEARESYRRLVNRWHPDRFASRPRERQHAQVRFIEVTKSYKNLREYHRSNGRLPLQDPALRDTQQSAGTPPEPTLRSNGHASRGASVANEAGLFAENNRLTSPKKSKLNIGLWSMAVIALVATISLFVVLEKRVSEKVRQDGIDVLRETEPSEFLPKRN